MKSSMNVGMKFACVMAFIVTFGKITYAQQGDKTVYWYVDGEKNTYTLHEDEVVLQTDAAHIQQFTANKQVDVLPIDVYDGTQLLKVHTNDALTATGEGVKLLLPLYKDNASLPVLIDNRLMVTFKESPVSEELLKELMTRYNMSWENPEIADLPEGGIYTYLFQLNTTNMDVNAATVSANIYEEYNSVVKAAQPNRVNHAQVDGDGLDNPNFFKSWHLENNGQRLFCSANSGQNDADVGATEAWNAGFTGQGITVAVIDIGGFDFNHPDLQGQLLPGWDCINNTPYDAGNYYFTSANEAHGMGVTGIIAAKGDANGATGVAYNAKVIPLLINGSESSILLALQKALSMDVDVINMSFGTGYSEAVKQQIENLVNLGREHWGEKNGTIIIASHGNNGQDDDVAPQWPSAYPQVISVSASTPDDGRKEAGDNWNVGSSWATNYGNKLDLAAPGVCIYTTDIQGSAGYSSTEFGGLQKTSAAAPIVSGVAALLLSKNNNLSWEEVREKLLNGADKVKQGQYNYNHDGSRPGHSKEMGYGRVNAYSAINSTPVGVGQEPVIESTPWEVTVTNPVTDQLDVMYSSNTINETIELQVYNMSGQLMTTSTLSLESNKTSIDVSGLSPGMYFTRFLNQQDEVAQSQKFIKLW